MVLRIFGLSFAITIVSLIVAFLYGGPEALLLTLILGILEVSLSFDNAVINATVLRRMSEFWQKIFLTVGVLIAVFGMRLVFPLAIVWLTAGLDPAKALDLALNPPANDAAHFADGSPSYETIITDAHPQIAAFGGMFLLLVSASFIFDAERKDFWLEPVENLLARIGKADSAAVIVAILVLLSTKLFVPAEIFPSVLLSGICGILLFLAVDSIDAFFEVEDEEGGAAGIAKRAGIAAFLYLEVLDASFSFDGVIGAFAITRDVVVIMLGLAIGAMFVRSLTVYLVHKGTLDQFIFLEHGAHYAIGALALVMLFGIVHHIPEVVTGLIGVVFIAASVWSSIRYRRLNPEPRASGGDA